MEAAIKIIFTFVNCEGKNAFNHVFFKTLFTTFKLYKTPRYRYMTGEQKMVN